MAPIGCKEPVTRGKYYSVKSFATRAALGSPSSAQTALLTTTTCMNQASSPLPTSRSCDLLRRAFVASPPNNVRRVWKVAFCLSSPPSSARFCGFCAMTYGRCSSCTAVCIEINQLPDVSCTPLDVPHFVSDSRHSHTGGPRWAVGCRDLTSNPLECLPATTAT